ncbi:centrosomal protein of 128 kDa-like [Stegostoma tigrinum]|uniref:centrosomal protein of 128 kDa-like n=1 Tax=Stegostoma tigrinum TaxID=3053191 RepID=UPI00202B5C5E|nr:centrosomal protein of 128 kDa-like [Stegostoma tigrinum]
MTQQMDSRSQSPGLEGVRKDIGDFLDSLDETLTTDSQQLPSKAPQLIQRMKYLHFQPQSSDSLLLEQLIKKLEECKREVCKHLEDIKFKGPSMTLQMRKVLEMIWEEKRALMKMKAECKDMSVMRAVLGTMQLQVKEKNEEIARLRRLSIVQLWEREKKKVVSEASERERVLKEETQDQKAQWMELKEKLIKKMKVQEEEIKKLRMKEKIYAKSLSHLETQNLKEELRFLKQQLLRTEEDLHKSQCEILRQQQHTTMFLTSLKTDLQNAAVRENTGYYLPSANFHHICSQLDIVVRAVHDGSLSLLPVDAPNRGFPQVDPVWFQISAQSPRHEQMLNDQDDPEKLKGASNVSVSRSASASGKKAKKGRRKLKARLIQRSIHQSDLTELRTKSMTPPHDDAQFSSSPTDQGKQTTGDENQSNSEGKGQLAGPHDVKNGV